MVVAVRTAVSACPGSDVVASVVLVVRDGHGAGGTGLGHAVLEVDARLVRHGPHLLQQEPLTHLHTRQHTSLDQSLDHTAGDDSAVRDLGGYGALRASDWERAVAKAGGDVASQTLRTELMRAVPAGSI